MAKKYLCKLRRGWKNDASERDDWATYEGQAGHLKPQPGELVVEYDNGIPRLKLGDGSKEFSELSYISVDSFILPTQASVTLYPDKWHPVLDENEAPIWQRYYQPVTVDNALITPSSKIDLQPTPEDLLIFYEKDLTFTTINKNGNVRVCVVGQKPTKQYTIQVTVTETVAQDGEIIGNTTTTPMAPPVSDWAQDDENASDYIKNKPEIIEKDYVDNSIENALAEAKAYADGIIASIPLAEEARF